MPDVTLETRPDRHVVGMARDYTMQTRDQIPQLWQAYFAAPPAVSDAVAGAMFGVSFMADGQGAFRYAVGVEVGQAPDAVPPGTWHVVLDGGTYAVLRTFGSVSELPRNFDWLYTQGIAGAGATPRNGAMFEVYPDDPRNGPDGMAYEIWAPVKVG